MFYHFLFPLRRYFFAFNLFQYVTFRAAYAVVTSIIISFIIGPLLIKYLQRNKIGEKIRHDGPKSHHKKAGTPTFGGLIIIFSALFSILLWGRFDNRHVLIVVMALVGFGVLGFFDDIIKHRTSKGISVFVKLLTQVLIALAIGICIYYKPEFLYPRPELGNVSTNIITSDGATLLYLPFYNKPVLDLSHYYILFVVFIIVGFSNAVNLTDGLDGLAIGLFLACMMAFLGFAYVSGDFKIASYLKIPYIGGTRELSVVIATMIGASLGFLWFNSHPAQIFMGDTGALTLGGFIGLMAILLKKEAQLVIAGGLFIAEALSVVIQVFWYKLTKKRVFLMAPIHHHYELKGMDESKIIARFWILGIILSLISLSTLKIR